MYLMFNFIYLLFIFIDSFIYFIKIFFYLCVLSVNDWDESLCFVCLFC